MTFKDLPHMTKRFVAVKEFCVQKKIDLPKGVHAWNFALRMIEHQTEFRQLFSSKRGRVNQFRDAYIFYRVESSLGRGKSKSTICKLIAEDEKVRVSPLSVANIHALQKKGPYGEALATVESLTGNPRNIVAGELCEEIGLSLDEVIRRAVAEKS